MWLGSVSLPYRINFAQHPESPAILLSRFPFIIRLMFFSSQISFASWIFCRCFKIARPSFVLWKNHNFKVCLPNAEDSSKICSCIDLSRFEVVFFINTHDQTRRTSSNLVFVRREGKVGGGDGGERVCLRLLCSLVRWMAPSSSPQLCGGPARIPRLWVFHLMSICSPKTHPPLLFSCSQTQWSTWKTTILGLCCCRDPLSPPIKLDPWDIISQEAPRFC